MKFWSLLLAFALCVYGCEKKDASRSDAPPAKKEKGLKSTTAEPTTARPTTVKPTAEQLSSTLRVRVTFGGLPPRSYTGALVHRDDVANKAVTYGKSRLVLALLKGWTEKQLRSPNARISVIRNRFDREQESVSSGHAAQLLQLNEQSGIAVLSYMDDFEYAMEVGFHLDRTARLDEPIGLLRTSSSTASNSQQMRTLAPFSVEAGTYRPVGGTQGRVELPSTLPNVTSDEIHLAVRPPDKLTGFVEVNESGAGAITTVENVNTQVPSTVVNTLGVAFGASKGDSIKFGITTEVTSGELTPRPLEIRIVPSPAADLLKTVTAAAQDVYAPVDERSQRLERNYSKPEQWLGSLMTPSNEGEECVYLLQPTWRLLPSHDQPSVNGKPFIVKLQKKGGEIYPVVEGIPNLNPVQTAAKEPPISFVLESRVVDLQEIAGGREVLMQLDGPPFWKRFSFERNEWLPMPPINLANVYITGNLSALFVLDRGAAEVRKYNLADLRSVASAKLRTGAEYVAILGGCNSERAPIHVVSKADVMSLSSETLLRQDVPRPDGSFRSQELDRRFSLETRFHVPGDGLAFSPGGGVYTDDALGLNRKLFDVGTMSMEGCGVSAVYGVSQEANRHSWLDTFATPNGERLLISAPQESSRGRSRAWAGRNSPVIFRLNQGSYEEVPSRPPRVELFSFFDTTPFAEVAAAEFEAVIQEGTAQYKNWFSFDPYSLRLGSLSADRKAWTVHQVAVQEGRKQPVLLNWPDTSLMRGGEFKFKPVILGGTKFEAELRGVTETASPIVNGGVVSFRVAPAELASLFMMTMKVPGHDGGELSYNIPLHVFGPQFPVVFPDDSEIKDINSYGAGFKSLANPKQSGIALPATRHVFNDPVQQVLGPVAGHLVLVTSAKRVDFLSLQTRKVVSSLPSSAKAFYYAGAEALFEYESESRTLTRISVPDGRREHSMTLPKDLRLYALAVGTHRSSPLTLILEQIQAQETDRFGGVTVTTTKFDRNAVVLDNRSLQAGGWAQPKLWIRPDLSQQIGNPFNHGGPKSFPDQLPSSYSGQFVTLPYVFLALGGQGVSMAASFPSVRNDLFKLRSGPPSPKGSISGMSVSDTTGDVFKGGVSDNYPASARQVLEVTPCGRYRLLRVNTVDNGGDAIEVRTVEGDRPLFRVGRLSLFQGKFGTNQFVTIQDQMRRRVAMLSEAGPLMVMADGGKAFDLIDFDIPRLARETNPAEFHITSQPAPCVMEGGTLDYQIQSNNPEKIEVYRIRNEMPGVTLSPTGLLRYTAPRPVAEPTRVDFSVEVVGKDGQTVLHEFPLFVLPFPKANATPKQENTRKQGI